MGRLPSPSLSNGHALSTWFNSHTDMLSFSMCTLLTEPRTLTLRCARYLRTRRRIASISLFVALAVLPAVGDARVQLAFAPRTIGKRIPSKNKTKITLFHLSSCFPLFFSISLFLPCSMVASPPYPPPLSPLQTSLPTYYILLEMYT